MMYGDLETHNWIKLPIISTDNLAIENCPRKHTKAIMQQSDDLD
ncbi:MAG: hypothetical protein AAGD05_07885 [Bacteroidota bacterium]